MCFKWREILKLNAEKNVYSLKSKLQLVTKNITCHFIGSIKQKKCKLKIKCNKGNSSHETSSYNCNPSSVVILMIRFLCV